MTTAIALREPWEKQKGESGVAFSAFSSYRDLGPARSLQKVATLQAKSIQLMKEWSAKWHWVSRADAFDFMEDRRRREEQQDQERAMLRRHRGLSVSMGNLAFQRAAGRQAGVREDGTIVEAVEALNPADLSASDVARLAEVGVKIERMTMGLATDLTKSLGDVPIREVSAIVSEIVEAALGLLPEESHESFVRIVRAIGSRRR